MNIQILSIYLTGTCLARGEPEVSRRDGRAVEGDRRMAGKMEQPAERWGRHTEIPQNRKWEKRRQAGRRVGGREGREPE